MDKFDIERAKEDQVYAIENVLGIKLDWYQKFTLRYLNYFDLKFRNRSWIRIPSMIKHRNLYK